MRWYWLVIGILCTWRISHLVAAEDGPGRIIARLRQRAGRRWWGQLMDCFSCLSLWVAAPFAIILGESPRDAALLWLAFSGGAILLERITAREHDGTATYVEHSPEVDDGLLRQGADERASGGRRESGR